jgi:hypothetical protein
MPLSVSLWVRNYLSKGLWIVALRHTKMAREHAVLRAAAFYATESMLGRSPNEIFHMQVVGELVAKFQRLEERRSRLE